MNPHPLLWQADPYPLYYQGSPWIFFFKPTFKIGMLGFTQKPRVLIFLAKAEDLSRNVHIPTWSHQLETQSNNLL